MKKIIFIFIFLLIVIHSYAAAPVRQNTYVTGETISTADVMANEDVIFAYLGNGVDTYEDGSIVSADIENASIVAADISSNIVNSTLLTAYINLSDGDFLDMSAINASNNREGIKLPQNTSCSSATAEGQLCWDTDDDKLYVGTGTS